MVIVSGYFQRQSRTRQVCSDYKIDREQCAQHKACQGNDNIKQSQRSAVRHPSRLTQASAPVWLSRATITTSTGPASVFLSAGWTFSSRRRIKSLYLSGWEFGPVSAFCPVCLP